MEYLYNYEEDIVVRVNDKGQRFFKTLDNLNETLSINKNSKAVWGIPSYGITNMLYPITKEQYDSFGIDWKELNL